jgi:outer membrane immunogenic protein
MICPSRTSAAAGDGLRKISAAWRGRPMGVCVTAALLLTALPASRASAADWIDNSLRGTFGGTTMRWDGIYGGAQLGIANTDADFSNTTSSFVSYSLRETALQNEIQPSTWAVMPSQIAHGRSYGAFLGYNVQWDQLVVGGELAYNRASGMDPSATDSITRVVTPSTGTDTVKIGGTESIKLNDYATFRARAGYAMGQFLPYAFVGGVVGRFDYSRNLFLTVTGADNGSYTLNESKSNSIVGGVTTGLGMDVALTPNIYVRGEWEYNAFVAVAGIRVNTNTARVGLGVRF